VVDSGCISTTLSINTANSFILDDGVLLVIYLKKGSRACYIQSISNYKHEYELLLPPGSVFKILSIESRKANKNHNIAKGYGLVYRLLLVGTITTNIMDDICGNNEKWLKLKDKIKPKR